jgi:hypothetical protein
MHFSQNFGIQALGGRDHIHVYGFWWSITTGLRHAHFEDWWLPIQCSQKKGLNIKILQWLTQLKWLPLGILAYTIVVITKLNAQSLTWVYI